MSAMCRGCASCCGFHPTHCIMPRVWRGVTVWMEWMDGVDADV